MTIETNLQRIADTNDLIVNLLSALSGNTTTPVAPTPVAPTPVSPTPVAPTPVSPTPVSPVEELKVPFADKPGLMQYVMNKYKTLGPEKGALIQNVLTQLGYSNMNDVTPENYGAFFNGVEGIQ